MLLDALPFSNSNSGHGVTVDDSKPVHENSYSVSALLQLKDQQLWRFKEPQVDSSFELSLG